MNLDIITVPFVYINKKGEKTNFVAFVFINLILLY